MNYNTQNAKIASITEKTLIIGIDVGSETHYARAFSWRNYEYSKKWNVTGKRPPEGAVTGKKSVIQQTKNEPVVGRNIFQRA